jgi:predicted SprT family Zn-dependent metalloprotease
MLEQRAQEVLNKVQALIEQAKIIYGEDCVPQNLPIRFDLRGRSAGQACRHNGQYWMRFNRDMMATESWDHIIRNTVPHEVAHIICMHRGWDRGHGSNWQRVCRTLGGTGERCHSEPVKYAKGQTYYYTTSTGKTVALSVIRHRKVQQGGSYSLRGGGLIDRNCAYRVA